MDSRRSYRTFHDELLSHSTILELLVAASLFIFISSELVLAPRTVRDGLCTNHDMTSLLVHTLWSVAVISGQHAQAAWFRENSPD